MKPSAFGYHRPRSLDEALDTLARLGADAKVLAGGQSLVPLMSMRLSAPAHLVDVNHVPGLADVEVSEDVVRVGALVRHSALEHHAGARAAAPLLHQAVSLVAHPTIRNRGTTVGSLVHADPAAELPAVLVLLDGVVRLCSAEGTREVAAADFFTGPMDTALRPGELAVAATFRRPAPGSGSAFVEVSRRQGDYAICGVGAVVGPSAVRGDPTSARVALIGVGDGPVLLDVSEVDVEVDVEVGVERTGAARDLDVRLDALLDRALEPEGDIHASADYRRHLAGVLLRRALQQARSARVAAA